MKQITLVGSPVCATRIKVRREDEEREIRGAARRWKEDVGLSYGGGGGGGGQLRVRRPDGIPDVGRSPGAGRGRDCEEALCFFPPSFP